MKLLKDQNQQKENHNKNTTKPQKKPTQKQKRQKANKPTQYFVPKTEVI